MSGSMDSTGGHQRVGSGPFVTTTTVTTVTDLSTGTTRTLRSAPWGINENKVYEKVGLHNILSENDISLIKSSWNTLKKRGDFAPKVFVR